MGLNSKIVVPMVSISIFIFSLTLPFATPAPMAWLCWKRLQLRQFDSQRLRYISRPLATLALHTAFSLLTRLKKTNLKRPLVFHWWTFRASSFSLNLITIGEYSNISFWDLAGIKLLPISRFFCNLFYKALCCWVGGPSSVISVP